MHNSTETDLSKIIPFQPIHTTPKPPPKTIRVSNINSIKIFTPIAPIAYDYSQTIDKT